MLLYSLLHLAEVAEKDGANAPAVSLEDIKKFRQLDSATPGHPEYHFTTGVEVTTGPLGQGVANSVGMAMGGRFSASAWPMATGRSSTTTSMRCAATAT